MAGGLGEGGLVLADLVFAALFAAARAASRAATRRARRVFLDDFVLLEEVVEEGAFVLPGGVVEEGAFVLSEGVVEGGGFVSPVSVATAELFFDEYSLVGTVLRAMVVEKHPWSWDRYNMPGRGY